jgi:hypothetical protein
MHLLPRLLGLTMLTALPLVLSGCATGGPAAARTDYWHQVDSPAAVMDAYIGALSKGEVDRAIAYLYLPSHVNEDDLLRERMAGIAKAVQGAKAEIRVQDSRAESRLALVIYTSGGDLANPRPIFLLRDTSNHWRLHHRETAGPLQQALRDRHDFLAARALANWGAQRMAEISRQARSAGNGTPGDSTLEDALHIAAE